MGKHRQEKVSREIMRILSTALLEDAKERKGTAQKMKSVIDGHGAERIAEDTAQFAEKNKQK